MAAPPAENADMEEVESVIHSEGGSDTEDGVLASLTDEWQTELPPPPPAPHREAHTASSALATQLAYTSPRDPSLRVSLLLNPSRGIAFQLWPAAHLLCSYIDSPALAPSLRGSTVVELGAGCGLVGMVAAALGAHVTLTDLPDVEAHLQLNIAANAHLFAPLQPAPSSPIATFTSTAGGSVTTSPLSWGEPTHLTPPDHLLLSDCIYWEHLFTPLLDTLFALTSAHTRILLSQTPRRNKVEQRFFRATRKCFEWEERCRGKVSGSDRQWMVVLEGRRRETKDVTVKAKMEARTPSQ